MFGILSFSLVAALYGILCVMLLTSWRGRSLGGFLIAACFVSTIWALLLAASAADASVPVLAIFVVEVLRGGAWLTFLGALVSRIGVSGRIGILAHAVWITVLLAGLALWLGSDYFGPIVDLGSVLIPGGLVIALVGLILIEQLYRNSAPESRSGIKAMALGLGGLFAFDLFLYSQGVLFSAVEPTLWQARGAVNLIFIPLIAIAARRNPHWDLDIFVSRQVVFYSTTLVAVGGYLLLMSLGGYALLLYGGTWGALAQMVFLVGAGLVLAILLFSSSLRARYRVFLSKHFFRNRYDYREEWLRLISTVSEFEDSSTRQIVIKAMAQIVHSPGGFLWTIDDIENEFNLVAVYKESISVPEIPADSSLIEFIRDEGWLIDIEEFRASSDLYGNLQMPEWLVNDPRFWLVIPLSTGKQLVGIILLTKPDRPIKLNYEDRDLLKTVGNHLAVHLAQEKSDILLNQARQFDAYNRLTAFLMHDLNNLIAQQSLIVKNAEKHKRNPEFVDDAIQTIAGSVERMSLVMAQLNRGQSDSSARRTELKFVVSAAVDRCRDKNPQPEIEPSEENAIVEVDTDQFVMIMMHLIKNAQDATSVDGTVRIGTKVTHGEVAISISDSGAGMTPEFVRNRLFRPFDSTKGSRGMGIGAYQAREFVRNCGGDLKVDSEVSRGTTIIVTLPLAS